MIRLVCIDIDGTLVGSSAQVHPRVWEAAAKARAAGLHLAICTGRPALGVTRQYGVDLDPQGWHIFQSGASILQVASGESISSPMPLDALATLKQLQATHNWVLELYSDTDYVVEDYPEGSDLLRLASGHAGLLELPYAPRPLESLQGQLIRAQWVVANADLAAVMATEPEGMLYSAATSPSIPDANYVSVTAAGVDKCSAIARLGQHLGISLAETMMIGDGQNDISALQQVGWPVAMGNADPRLKAVAKHIVPSVDEGGVADALALALAQ